MDTRLRKFLRSHVFDKKEANVYIVSINDDNSIRDIKKAKDHDAVNTSVVYLHYYEIKRLRNNAGVTHYIYRSVNKMPEDINYTCI
nr:maco-A 161 [Mamestra configurata nucleopolyhedrovirus A]